MKKKIFVFGRGYYYKLKKNKLWVNIALMVFR